jgi:ferritin
MSQLRDRRNSVPNENPLISQIGIDLLNYRINQEELSSRTYLARSVYLDSEGYVGAAKLWAKYSAEELVHASWSREYLLSVGEKPLISPLEPVQTEFNGLPEIIQLSYEHEIEITRQCQQLASQALNGGDFMLFTLAQKFLTEQIEEHDKTIKWVDRLRAFGQDLSCLRLLDTEMGQSL